MIHRRIPAVISGALCAGVLLAAGTAQTVRAGHLADKSVSYTNKETGMTLTIARPQLDPNGDQITHPAHGMMFQLMYVRVRNGGASSRHFNPLDVGVVDNHGKTFKVTFLLPKRYRPQLNLVSVPHQATRAGWIGYQIPRKTKYIDVTWNDQFSLDPPVRVVRIHVR